MKILILTNYFPPEIGGAAHLFYELAESLVQRGHHVTVVTGFPRYNIKERPEPYRGRRLMWEEINGVRVLRIWMPTMPRTNLILRGLEHFLVPAILFLGGLFSRQHDVVLIYSPPLPLGLAAYGLSRIRRIPFVVNVQDLFPKEAVLLGLLKNKVLIRLFEAIERFIYRKADFVTVHSPGNREHVLAHGGHPERVRVVHNWVDVERVRPLPRENSFSHEHGLDGRFVISYAGTMGWCQDMLVIVEAAHYLRDYQDIVFLMVGDGPEKAKTEEQARRLGLGNMIFLPMQPWSRYPEVLAASDISMINLNKNLTTPVVPSKLLNIMAAGRPVVASLPLNGDAPKIVAEAGCGLCVEAGDAQGLAQAILSLYHNPEQAHEMGWRGRLYAEEHFSRESCVARYEEIFRQACARWGKTC
jgi:glycosyltransferase involved in cell wall biosynthesis